MCVCGRTFASRPKKADAECISDALIEYGSEVAREGKRWTVHVFAQTAPELTAVLVALKTCLDENAIALVKVRIDGQAYAMEGTEARNGLLARDAQGVDALTPGAEGRASFVKVVAAGPA